MRSIVITGTSTGVGKTIVTAALVTALAASGRRVAMVKPAQTGVTLEEPTDVETVRRLGGTDAVTELVRLDDPLAPDTAARLRGVALPTVAELAAGALDFGTECAADVLVVEGAGGLLVRLDLDGGTLADLADSLDAGAGSPAAEVVVVTTLALGTLNHTELTVEVLRARGLTVAGLVLGSVADRLDLAGAQNLGELPRVTGLPVLAAIPAEAGGRPPEEFRRACPGWWTPAGREWLYR